MLSRPEVSLVKNRKRKKKKNKLRQRNFSPCQLKRKTKKKLRKFQGKRQGKDLTSLSFSVEKRILGSEGDTKLPDSRGEGGPEKGEFQRCFTKLLLSSKALTPGGTQLKPRRSGERGVYRVG